MNDSKMFNQLKTILNNISNEDLFSFTQNLIEFVKQNESKLEEISDKRFVDFIKNVNLQEYFIGETGDNFKVISNGYVNKGFKTTDDVWRIASSLVWDLLTFESEIICPRCSSDNLRVFVNTASSETIFSCETCFYSQLNGKEIKRPETLVPASKIEIQAQK
jgi:hypothetical protein